MDFADQLITVQLWPNAAPGSESWMQTEQMAVNPADHIKVLRNITRPTLTV